MFHFNVLVVSWKGKTVNTQSPSPAERLPSLDRSSRVLSYITIQYLNENATLFISRLKILMQTPKIFKNALGKTQDCDFFADSSASSKVLCSALILTKIQKLVVFFFMVLHLVPNWSQFSIYAQRLGDAIRFHKSLIWRTAPRFCKWGALVNWLWNWPCSWAIFSPNPWIMIA